MKIHFVKLNRIMALIAIILSILIFIFNYTFFLEFKGTKLLVSYQILLFTLSIYQGFSVTLGWCAISVSKNSCKPIPIFGLPLYYLAAFIIKYIFSVFFGWLYFIVWIFKIIKDNRMGSMQ